MADKTKLPAELAGFLLPCDVMLPPTTIIRAGCPVSTLLSAMTAIKRPPFSLARLREAVAEQRGFERAREMSAEIADRMHHHPIIGRTIREMEMNDDT